MAHPEAPAPDYAALPSQRRRPPGPAPNPGDGAEPGRAAPSGLLAGQWDELTGGE